MSKKIVVVIPSRRERWLQPTIDALLRGAKEEIEIWAVLQNYWPDPPLREDRRLIQLHRVSDLGMRQNINAAIRASQSDFILKCDGHTNWAEGWDVELKKHCDDKTIIVPRRFALDVEAWAEKSDKPPVDAYYLSYPFKRKNDVACGLHGNVDQDRARREKGVQFAPEMSSQGSAYFLSRKFWEEVIGPLDSESYGNFASEFQEVGCKAWLSGGRVMTLKTTWYSHLFKGKTYGTGYGFSTEEWKDWQRQNKKGHDHAIDFWIGDKDFKGKTRSFRWLIEEAGFWPVPEWPQLPDGSLDWDTVMADYETWRSEVLGTEPPMTWLEKGAE